MKQQMRPQGLQFHATTMELNGSMDYFFKQVVLIEKVRTTLISSCRTSQKLWLILPEAILAFEYLRYEVKAKNCLTERNIPSKVHC